MTSLDDISLIVSLLVCILAAWAVLKTSDSKSKIK